MHEGAKRAAKYFSELKEKSDNPNYTVLDLCCGEGRATDAISRTGIKTIGTDVSILACELSRHGVNYVGAMMMLP